MRGLGFSESDIKANREHNGGKLYLSPAVVILNIRGELPDHSVDAKTGDLLPDLRRALIV